MKKMHRLDKIACLLAVLAFIAYASTLSCSLDDWDSVQFALGLNEFDVSKHQPHPPGFPVYMALGKAFFMALGDETLALTLMSAVFGAASVFVLYALVSEMVNRKAGIIAAVFMALTPLFWLNSVKAMSDATALFFALLSIVFIHRHVKGGKAKWLYLGAGLSAVTAGARVHYLFLLVPMLLYAGFLNRKKARENLAAFIIFVLVAMAWLLPTMLLNGPEQYLSSSADMFNYRVGKPHNSILGVELTGEFLAGKADKFAEVFLTSGYGIDLSKTGLAEKLMLVLMAGLIFISIKGAKLRRKKVMLFAVSLPVYLAAVYSLLPPSNPRYLLILVPVLSAGLACGALEARRKSVVYVLAAAMALLLLAASLPLALEIRAVPSPPVQMVQYINSNLKEGDILIRYPNGWRFFDYYDVRGLAVSNPGCNRMKEILSKGGKVLAMYEWNICQDLEIKRYMSFERNRKVHQKHNKIGLYEVVLKEG